MREIAIVNGNVILYGDIVKANVIIKNGKIAEITNNIPLDAHIIDADGMYISPGFIDIHTHGAGGYETMMGTYDAVNNFSKALAQYGVTSFLPTTITASVPSTQKAISAVREAIIKGTDGSKVVGVHLEGPFINEKFKGAHPSQYLLKPSIQAFKELAGDSEDIVKNITISPEATGALELGLYLSQRGVNVSIGHSDADYETVKTATLYGFSHATHTFNGMKGFHHREPGTLGAIMDLDEITAEVIADGIHSSFASIRVLIKCKGVEKTILVSDSMMATGLDDGVYNLGAQDVIVKDGQARLKDGTLAGSTLTLNRAVKNAVNNCKVTLSDAVLMASYNPAKKIGLNSTKGLIKPGFDADVVILDKTLDVCCTIVQGRVVYRRQNQDKSLHIVLSQTDNS